MLLPRLPCGHKIVGLLPSLSQGKVPRLPSMTAGTHETVSIKGMNEDLEGLMFQLRDPNPWNVLALRWLKLE